MRSNALLSTFLFLCLFLATGCSYRSGSLLQAPDTNTRAARQRGCVDVAVTLADDARVQKPSALLLYAFGNRCEHPETFDLARVVVTGVNDDGTRLELAFNDPGNALHPELIEADASGKELIRYDVPKIDGKAVSDVKSFDRICVDLLRVVDEPQSSPEICLTPPGDPKALVDNDVQHHPIDGSGFGWGWSVEPFPRVRFDLGVSGYSVGTQDTRLTSPRVGTVNAADAFGARRVGGATLDLRITGFVTDRVYVGGELSVGGGPAPGGVLRSRTEDIPVLTERSNFQITTGAILGVAIDRVGPMQPRFELYGGARILLSHAGTDNCQGAGGCTNLVGVQPFVMPRIGADFWMNPFLTIGPWFGVDLVNQASFAGGLTFALHGRAYDGRRK